MKKIIQLAILTYISMCIGCVSIELDKDWPMPDSITLSYMQEQFKGDTSAWRGVGVSATWELK